MGRLSFLESSDYSLLEGHSDTITRRARIRGKPRSASFSLARLWLVV
jgi:hypothetical protein